MNPLALESRTTGSIVRIAASFVQPLSPPREKRREARRIGRGSARERMRGTNKRNGVRQKKTTPLCTKQKSPRRSKQKSRRPFSPKQEQILSVRDACYAPSITALLYGAYIGRYNARELTARPSLPSGFSRSAVSPILPPRLLSRAMLITLNRLFRGH